MNGLGLRLEGLCLRLPGVRVDWSGGHPPAPPDPDKANVNAQVKNRQRKGRKRRLTGWTLIALGLLVAGVWGGSKWWGLRWRNNETYVALGYGQIVLQLNGMGPGFQWGFESWADFKVNWLTWYGFDSTNDGSRKSERKVGLVRVSTYRADYYTRTDVDVLFWPIPLLLWAAGVPVLRSGILARRRAMTGSCSKCGYSLAGLSEGAGCPECGKGMETKAESEKRKTKSENPE